MALTQKQRDERTALKRQKAGEEELRLRVRPGTKQALRELMEWAMIEERAEAMTLMIHHLHALGPIGALQFLQVPRHEITVSPVVARKLELAYRREEFRIGRQEQP
ncbi:hypothetical protein V2K16_22860 [Pseudomonas alliivorans]|uniref:hypothetical protein n=1 Tax=Pseudomonas alliivorans TaxID=2810613 RepID=UPI001AE409EB|nr:hypothetical protein [Pseudomonas alliivorans]MBP0943122.1 hypothetical protein [Pseudomonas alliivorans]MEE4881218.1 hypothetical protein [Pseudomonas alliivorans]MEE4932522.1 hypothetical protein [Pseudomonas alliivorans]MEE4937985.1 hypothetical protein [Pseudomonas alliivorans]MEE4943082.1 hypothetical protein [Pseudomonas alliivorans]